MIHPSVNPSHPSYIHRQHWTHASRIALPVCFPNLVACWVVVPDNA